MALLENSMYQAIPDGAVPCVDSHVEYFPNSPENLSAEEQTFSADFPKSRQLLLKDLSQSDHSSNIGIFSNEEIEFNTFLVSPSGMPSGLPTSVLEPSSDPTGLPTLAQPTAIPVRASSYMPTMPSNSPVTSNVPTTSPITVSSSPSPEPSTNPSKYPTEQPQIDGPSATPTMMPIELSSLPTGEPSGQSTNPTGLPTGLPTTVQSSGDPTSRPSVSPSNAIPTASPTMKPIELSSLPSGEPSSISLSPISYPTGEPTMVQSHVPNNFPSASPSSSPSSTSGPSASPSSSPSRTSGPSASPSSSPSSTSGPSAAPSSSPSSTSGPSASPSSSPSSTSGPSASPSSSPSSTSGPSVSPSSSPSSTSGPSASPSSSPSNIPSQGPSSIPNFQSEKPSLLPTISPSSSPSSTYPKFVGAIAVMTSGSTYVTVTGTVTSPARVFCGIFLSTATTSLTTLNQITNQATVFASESLIPITVSISHLPTSLIKISLQVQRVDVTEGSMTSSECLTNTMNNLVNIKNSTVLDHSEVVFSKTSSSLDSSFTFSSNIGGCYLITPAINGLSLNEYNVSYVNAPMRIFITKSLVDIPAPILSSAMFSSDGLTVSLHFDKDTDKAMTVLGRDVLQFKCSLLFNISGEGIDVMTRTTTTSMCVWNGAASVIMYPSTKVVVGTSISVWPMKIRAACPATLIGHCGQLNFVDTSVRTLVFTPVNPLSPVLSVSYPKRIGVCMDLSIDASLSQNSGGRPWKQVSISLLTSESTTDTNTTALQSYLASFITSTSTKILIPNRYIHPPNSYSFRIELTNFLGASSSAIISVVAEYQVLPQVAIEGQSVINTVRSRQLTLTSTSSVSNCNGATSTFGIITSWFIYKDNNLISIPNLSKNSRRYFIDSYILDAASQYVFIVQASKLGNHANTSVVVNVGRGTVIAKISGGDKRAVKSNSKIFLDASTSENTDMKGLLGENAGLSFVWQCSLGGMSCWDDGSSDGGVVVETKKSNITVEGPFIEGKTYNFMCTVTYGIQSSSASVAIIIANSTSPDVSIGTLPAVINPNNKLKLKGIVNPATTATAIWQLNGNASRMANIATSGAISIINSFSSPTTIELLLPANVLLPGVKYTFSLVCKLKYSDKIGFASVDIQINSPPSPGMFSIDPVKGTFLKTEFTMSASYWTAFSSSSYPLSYVFGYADPSSISTSTSTMIALNSISSSNTIKSYLPTGISSSNYQLNCKVYIYDAYFAVSNSITAVTVNQQDSLTLSDVTKVFTNLLGNSTQNSNSNSFKTLSSLIVSYLNTVNCSSSPNCVTLNRNPCTSVDHTCGTCLTGFIGTSGASNSICISTSTYAALKAVGASCSANNECSTDLCSNKKCSIPLKTCTNKCSSNGICNIIDSITYKEIKNVQCVETDNSCDASCTCDDGYYGSYCQYDEVEYNAKKGLRSQALFALQNSVNLADETSFCPSLASWINTLNGVSSKPDEIDTIALDIDRNSGQFADYAVIGKCPYEDSLRLFSAISNSLAASHSSKKGKSSGSSSGSKKNINKMNSDHMNNIQFETITTTSATAAAVDPSVISSSTSALKIARAIASDMIIGQAPVEFTSDMESITVASNSYDQLRDVYIYPPVSSSDKLDSTIKASSVAIINATSTSTLSFQYNYIPDLMLSFISFVINPYGSGSVAMNATTNVHKVIIGPVAVTTATTTTATTAAVSSSLSFDVRIVLQHTISDGFTSEFSESVQTGSVRCLEDEHTLKKYTCPWSSGNGDGGDGVYSLKCNGTASTTTYNCMSEGKRTRYCGVFVDNAFQTNVCKVDSSTALSSSSTICLCTIQGSTSSSRRLGTSSTSSNNGSYQSDGLVAIDIIGLSHYSTAHFPIQSTLYRPNYTQTWSGAYVVIAGYCTAWILTLLFLLIHVRFTHGESKKEKLLKAKVEELARTVDKKGRIKKNTIAYLLELYLSTLFASLYAVNLPFFARIKFEICEHQRWFSIFFSERKTKERKLLQGLQLLTSISMTMFIVAYGIVLQLPEDLTCSTHHTKTDCEVQRSYFDSTVSTCFWTSDPPDGQPSCQWQHPQMNAQIFLIITVIIIIISTPVNSLISFLVEDIISAPTSSTSTSSSKSASSIHIENENDSNVISPSKWTLRSTSESYRIGRHLPMIAKHARTVLIGIIDELDKSSDSNELSPSSNHNHSSHHNSITRSSISDIKSTLFGESNNSERFRILEPNELLLFDTSWGLKKVEVNSSSSSSAESSITVIVIDTLVLIHNRALELKTLLGRSNVTDEMKGQEILLAFVIDLLGRDSDDAKAFIIHTNKDMKPIIPYPLWCRICAAVFIILINILFVVYTCIWGASKDYINMSSSSRNSDYEINAPTHLFVSNKVAKNFPDLIESKLINSYRSKLPGNIGKKWNSNGLIALGALPPKGNFHSIIRYLRKFNHLPLWIQGTIIQIYKISAVNNWGKTYSENSNNDDDNDDDEDTPSMLRKSFKEQQARGRGGGGIFSHTATMTTPTPSSAMKYLVGSNVGIADGKEDGDGNFLDMQASPRESVKASECSSNERNNSRRKSGIEG
eukprot:gene6538-13232_t